MYDYEEILENIARKKEPLLLQRIKVTFNIGFVILLFWALVTYGGNK